VYDPTTGAWTGVGPFATGNTLTLHVTGIVDAAATGKLVNTVHVTPPSGFPDRNPNNDTATDIDRLTPKASLSLVKELLTPLVDKAEARYRLTVTNAGPSAAHDVRVIDVMPATLVPTSASGIGWTCTISGQKVTCHLAGSLAPDDVAVIDVTATVHATVGTAVKNTAIATAVDGVGGRPVKAVAEASGVVQPDLPATGGAPIDLLRRGLELALLGVALLVVVRRRRRPAR
jgi:hypothetical protein